MKKQVVSRAPGKLILSGEYSVLVGMPAIAFAIDEFTETTATLTDENVISIDLKDYGLTARLSLEELALRYSRTQSRYNEFLSGLLPVENILEGPLDLCCFVTKKILELTPNPSSRRRPGPSTTKALSQRKLGSSEKIRKDGPFGESLVVLGLGLRGDDGWGVALSIQSSIPIASGFGSSAALIVSLLKALDALLCINLTTEKFYQLALEAENLVHGRSSGIDIRTSMDGGCNDLLLPPLFSIFTGRPEVSTGTSIAKVKELFETSDRKFAFESVTLSLKIALENQDLPGTISQVRANNFLLKELGVVPQKVQKFIEEIESTSGAAKICGSGAVSGENGGAVVALGDFDKLTEIAKRYNYSIKKVTPADRGAYVL